MKNPSLYVIFVGLSCGCPMAALSAASLYQKQRLGKRQAENLCGFCNCLSPAFLSGYCFYNMLQFEKIPLKFVAATYVPIFLMLILTKSFSPHQMPAASPQSESDPQNWIDILDNSIMNGFLAIAKLGGYIILCSILAGFVGLLVKSPALCAILTGLIEITNGVQMVAGASFCAPVKLLLIGGMFGFGGICCMLQTIGILRSSGLSIKKYIYHKILLGVLTTLSYLFVIYVL